MTRRPDLLFELIFHWYRQGQIACVFASMLAHDPKSAKWRSEIIAENFKVDTLNARIDELAQESAALQLIFPSLTTAKHTADLLVKLCGSSRWTCVEVPWKFGEQGRSIPIGLRWNAADGSYTSWVLGIAPFEPMPFTRRFVGAPFSALVFRPSPPATFAPTTDSFSGKPAAHLAHMNDGLDGNVELHNKIKQMTIDKKRLLLASDLWSTARAQVTFSLPLWCREIIAPILHALPAEGHPATSVAEEK
jgi:hypothetical protein